MRQVTTFPRSARLCAAFAIVVVMMRGAGAAAPPPKKYSPTPCAAWSDDFNTMQLDARWTVASGRAPGYLPGEHLGLYQPQQVTLGGGVLTMRLTQTLGVVDGVFGVISKGALLSTRDRCGYGTY